MITLKTLVDSFENARILDGISDAIAVENTEPNRLIIDELDRQSPGVVRSFVDPESQTRIVFIDQCVAALV